MPQRLFVGLQRPDPNYGPLELWDFQRRGPPIWSCSPDFSARGSICSLALADEANTVVAGMSSGSMYIYDARTNKSRCAAELKHSSSSSGCPDVLAMQLLSDMRSFVAVGDSGSIDVWDIRFTQQPRHSAVVLGDLRLTTVLGSQRKEKAMWPGLFGHSLFDPNIFAVAVDFDAGNLNDSMVLLMSTGAAIVVDMTKGFPLPEAVIKPHVDWRIDDHVTCSRGDDNIRFGVAWGRQGGRRMFYMSDNLSPPPSTGELRLSASHPGIYCVFPDPKHIFDPDIPAVNPTNNPTYCPPPCKLDPKKYHHWGEWWERCRSRFPSTAGSTTEQHEFFYDHRLKLLHECNHVPLPLANSHAVSDKVIAVAASQSFDLVAVATANGHVQTARARKAASLTARSAMFCRSTHFRCPVTNDKATAK